MHKLFTILTFVLLFLGFTFGQVFEISPPSLDFGNVVLGSNGQLQATVSNHRNK